MALVTEIEGEQVVVYIDDVYYVPAAEFGLFSPGMHVTKASTLAWILRL